MDAIISDIHGNLEALDAVLHSAKTHGADRVICLGDIVGYGPNPIECVEKLLYCDLFIAGDWDLAMVSKSDPDWNEHLITQLLWLRKQFAGRVDLIEFFRSGRSSRRIGQTTYFHGTPDDPNEWIFPETIYEVSKLQQIIAKTTKLSFCGHNHIAGLFILGDHWQYLSSKELGDSWHTISDTCIWSVGSVGQPRDEDPRASFALHDGANVRLVCVDYDIELTRSKILRNPNLAEMHGDRLRFGR